MTKPKAAKKFRAMAGSDDDRLPVGSVYDQFVTKGAKKYQLLDSGEGRKLEQIGDYLLDRQCAVAFWAQRNPGLWKKAQATHERTEQGGGFWTPEKIAAGDFWFTQVGRLIFKTKLTAFGHVGFFTEQVDQWDWFYEKLSAVKGSDLLRILNLFAYTGGTSIACAQAGALVTHVDAARGVVDWARQNATLNDVPENSIRYAVEDCQVFIDREAKRGNFYDGVILDPPSFGRGPNKEVFKIEENILALLRGIKKILSPQPKLFHLSSHSQGFSPEVLKNLTAEILALKDFQVETGEMLMREVTGRQVPSGQFLRLWRK